MLIGGSGESQPEDHFSSASSIPQSPTSTPPLTSMPSLPLTHSNLQQTTIVHSNDQRTEQDSSEVPTETPADAPIHDVRCGVLNAKLHMQRFTCPGIHRRCIEYDGKMITPRQFTIEVSDLCFLLGTCKELVKRSFKRSFLSLIKSTFNSRPCLGRQISTKRLERKYPFWPL